MSEIRDPKLEVGKNHEKISPKNSVDKNLQILKDRLDETKTWFNYKVTADKNYRLFYNNHELDLNIKNWDNLLASAKMIKGILDEYKREGFDKKKYRFYKEADPAAEKTDTLLKVDNNLILPDYIIWDWWEISEKLWSNLITKSQMDWKSVANKKNVNTGKVADFLNSILNDYFK